MKIIIVCISFILTWLNIVEAQNLPSYDSLINKLVTDFKTPGVVVAVMDNYEFTEYTHGVSHIESQEPMSKKTLFNLASISKIITAHSVMQLVDAQKINLDNPIEDYLKSWRFNDTLFDSRLVTTRSVLNHTAGLSREFGPGFSNTDSLLSLVDILSGKSSKRRALRIVQKPNSEQVYSNLGFGLLQILIEDVTGLSFNDYTKREVFDILAMQNSSFDDPLELKNNSFLAVPHDYQLNPLDQERFVVLAAAGLISNLQDMELLMLEESRNKTLNSLESLRELHYFDSSTGYGLGHMAHRQDSSVAFIGHTGLGMGWNSSFQFVPNSGDGIIILTNGDNGYYIHNTLTCYWYFSLTGKRIRSSIVAPDKKLNGISWYAEIANEEGEISNEEFNLIVTQIEICRSNLKDGDFSTFNNKLKDLQSRMSKVIINPEFKKPLNEAFASCFYWMTMQWFNNSPEYPKKTKEK